ncbi:hypothetical protein TREES_T100004153 [Tupaia chinensis]|uniref:Uncharacterized protein n=1 Tax=Tupaia chinensis TaxID=246437 RepID=L9KH45_TUPCH|nr:hypothetical protein TREES_T100004153 [Tupaia chinensis]
MSTHNYAYAFQESTSTPGLCMAAEGHGSTHPRWQGYGSGKTRRKRKSGRDVPLQPRWGRGHEEELKLPVLQAGICAEEQHSEGEGAESGDALWRFPLPQCSPTAEVQGQGERGSSEGLLGLHLTCLMA